MWFNRFDIVEAWFLALSECHEGQASTNYRRLSAMLTYFKPSPTLRVETLSENGRVIYDNAVRKLLVETWGEGCSLCTHFNQYCTLCRATKFMELCY